MQTMICFLPIMWFGNELPQSDNRCDTHNEPIKRNEENKLNEIPMSSSGTPDHVVIDIRKISNY